MQTRSILTFIALTGLAGPAMAQDSVSIGTGLPGDAVSPWSGVEQINDFVVQLTPFTSSKGHLFGIAPLLKSSKINSTNLTGLISAQAASPDQIIAPSFVAPSYMQWNAPGFGINNNPALNTPGANVLPPFGVQPVRIAVAFAEFSATNTLNVTGEQIIGATVEYDILDPGTLFVRRVMAVANDENGTGEEAAIGFGAIDASGFLNFRSDSFGLAFGTHPIPPFQNINGRVNILARTAGVVNVIGDVAGVPDGTDAAATDVPTGYTGTTHNTPGILPMSERVLAGGTARPVMLASNFSGLYRNELVAGTLSVGTALHRPGTVDHRGGVIYSVVRAFASGTAGTAALLSQPPIVPPSLVPDTQSISMWGLDPDGSIPAGAAMTLFHPATIADTSALDPYTYPVDYEFSNYQSQVAFRGGNGQVAIGQDINGMVLVAAPIKSFDAITPILNSDPEGGIAVARFDPANPAATLVWTLAAWNDIFPPFPQVSAGKGIYDDLGNRIGEFATLTEVTGGLPDGPSFSSPMFDAAGNLWFLAAAQLFNGLGDDDLTGEANDEYNTTLIRAIYDPATFTFECEKILDVGNVFTSLNNGLDWQVRFVGLADTNSISSGTAFSHNMVQGSIGDGPVGPSNNHPQASPLNLGGLVISAEIVYDVNGDGLFDKLTGAGGNPLSLDQEYNVLLYLGSGVKPPCPEDLSGDGSVNGADLGLLLGNWGNPGATDLNGDGTTDGADLGLLLGAWGPC
jgi:hypothetical protein